MAHTHIRERKRCLEVLGLTHSASEEDVRKAYRTLALQFHPDKNKSDNATERFQEIQGAYKYLREGPGVVHMHEDSDDDDDGIPIFILIRLFPWLFSEFTGARGPPPGAFRHDPFGYDTDSDEDDDGGFFFGASPFHPFTFMHPSAGPRSSGQRFSASRAGPTSSKGRAPPSHSHTAGHTCSHSHTAGHASASHTSSRPQTASHASHPTPCPAPATDKASAKREKKKRAKERKKAEKNATASAENNAEDEDNFPTMSTSNWGKCPSQAAGTDHHNDRHSASQMKTTEEAKVNADKEKAADEDDKAKKEAERVRKEANTEAERVKREANNVKEESDRARREADQARKTERAREEAAKVRQRQEKAKQEAERKRQEADKARQEADKVKQEADKVKQAEKLRQQKLREEQRKRDEDAAKDAAKIARDLEEMVRQDREKKERRQAAREEKERQAAEERKRRQDMEIAEEARRLREELTRKEEEVLRKKKEEEDRKEMARLMEDFDTDLFLDSTGDFVTMDTCGVGNIKKQPIKYDSSGYASILAQEQEFPCDNGDSSDYNGFSDHNQGSRGRGRARGRGGYSSPPSQPGFPSANSPPGQYSPSRHPPSHHSPGQYSPGQYSPGHHPPGQYGAPPFQAWGPPSQPFTATPLPRGPRGGFAQGPQGGRGQGGHRGQGLYNGGDPGYQEQRHGGGNTNHGGSCHPMTRGGHDSITAQRPPPVSAAFRPDQPSHFVQQVPGSNTRQATFTGNPPPTQPAFSTQSRFAAPTQQARPTNINNPFVQRTQNPPPLQPVFSTQSRFTIPTQQAPPTNTHNSSGQYTQRAPATSHNFSAQRTQNPPPLQPTGPLSPPSPLFPPPGFHAPPPGLSRPPLQKAPPGLGSAFSRPPPTDTPRHHPPPLSKPSGGGGRFQGPTFPPQSHFAAPPKPATPFMMAGAGVPPQRPYIPPFGTPPGNIGNSVRNLPPKPSMGNPPTRGAGNLLPPSFDRQAPQAASENPTAIFTHTPPPANADFPSRPVNSARSGDLYGLDDID